MSKKENNSSPSITIAALWICRMILAGLFIYAGTIKIANPASFAGSIATFEILPEKLVNLIALALPVFEIALGVGIVVSKTTKLSSLGIAILNLVFLIGLVSALIRGISIDCGCFGSSGPLTPKGIVVIIGRDILFLAMAIYVYFKIDRR